MNIKIITVLFLLTCFTACKKQNKIFISFSGESEMPEITIQNKNLKVPFKFSCNPKTGSGPVYFITPDGKTYVSGKPLKIIETEGKTSYTWNINQREIVISILNDSGKYRFSFYATPNIDILKWGMSIPATENEYFTGLFERVVDGNQEKSWEEGIKEALNLRGQEVDMIIKPTLSLYCPFYLSSNNYGLFINGTWPGHYDFCKTESNIVLIEFEGISLSGIIYTADYPAEIIKAHSLHIGPTIVPPKWAFLPWRWRDNHSNQPIYYDGTSVNAPYNSMVVEDILMMEALDIPNGAYWIDRPWARGFKGYEDFEWDNERFPGATNMIKWLHSKDIRIMLWLAPWVTGNMRQEAIEKGYSMPIKGPSYDLDSSNVALIDFTNPYACKWWQENGIEKMLKQGINGFKLDRAEELVPETNEIVLFDERTAREARNDYPVMYVRTVNESCKKNCGDDFVLFPRAGYSGSSKYSGFWGGDIGSPPEGLRAAIIAAQRSAIIGFPIWGSDIGGYWQGDLDREVCARWLAFGCFNPIMEFGPTEDRAPWNMDSEPNYDTTLIAVWRLYATIHTALAEYTYQHVKIANETGMPVIRPLFLVFPEQKEAWEDWQTFMYGDEILVSAIWEKNTKTHQCYLPMGETWIDAWNTDKIYTGGRKIDTETPLYKIPIFIRKGSKINLGDLNRLYNESLEIAVKIPDLRTLELKEKY